MKAIALGVIAILSIVTVSCSEQSRLGPSKDLNLAQDQPPP